MVRGGAITSIKTYAVTQVVGTIGTLTPLTFRPRAAHADGKYGDLGMLPLCDILVDPVEEALLKHKLDLSHCSLGRAKNSCSITSVLRYPEQTVDRVEGHDGTGGRGQGERTTK